MKMASKQNILITGSNGGIGSSISQLLAKDNENLFLLYNKNNDKILELENTYDSVKIIKTDISNSIELNNTLKNIISENSIDIFIHSPAYPIQHSDILKLSWEIFQEQLNLHLKSFFEISKFIVPQMKSNNYGKIISILTSYVVGKPPNLLADYVVAKHALLGMMKCMANELGPSGICVNSISPSMVDTPLTESLPKKLKEIYQSQVPLEKRLAKPIDVANIVQFLCSKNANYITGENILVSGGSTMH
tara:strand:- start:2312 stop:3055 length:744 start_codon:yes stop_codon:yes gene_type:complete